MSVQSFWRHLQYDRDVASEGRGTTHHRSFFWMRGLVLATWQPWKTARPNPSVFGVTWKLDICSTAGSGGKCSQRCETAMCGLEHCLLQKIQNGTTLVWANVQGRPTAPCAELMAMAVLAETNETAGLYVVKVDVQHLLTSMGRPESPKRGVHADLCSQFFEFRVTRLSRSHRTAKELDIECSPRFEVRGNIIEANLTAILAQPKLEFLPLRPSAHRKTRQQCWSELLELLHVSGHVLKRRSRKRDIYCCAKCGGASSLCKWQC